ATVGASVNYTFDLPDGTINTTNATVFSTGQGFVNSTSCTSSQEILEIYNFSSSKFETMRTFTTTVSTTGSVLYGYYVNYTGGTIIRVNVSCTTAAGTPYGSTSINLIDT